MGYDREEDSLYVYLNTFTSETKIFVASPSNFKWPLLQTRRDIGYEQYCG